MDLVLEDQAVILNNHVCNGNDSKSERDIIIDVRSLEKKFGDLKAVDNVSFQIKKGEIFSLLGPNGAGKSTTIRMLTTVLKPISGDVIIDDYSLKNQKHQIKSIIGVCPQDIVIFDALSAEDNVRFVAEMHGIDKKSAIEESKKLLQLMNIGGRKDACKNFSGGMKRRLNLVMGLVHKPKILFLDEPSAGLDPQARRLVWDFIRNLKKTGITIILTTHDMVEADALSDHIAIMDKGKIIAIGTPNELKKTDMNVSNLELEFHNVQDLNDTQKCLKNYDNIKNIQKISNTKIFVSFIGGIPTLKNEILECVIKLKNLLFRDHTLEDVFLNLTGRSLRD